VIQLPQAIASVMLGTLASGGAGGLVGFAIGRLAPTFVRWLYSPAGGAGAGFDPAEFGFGLGIVCGLFLGAGASLFLAMILVVRDTILGHRAQPISDRAGRTDWVNEK
jgi:hypothetical protein